MQDCFRQHPEMYGSELEDDEDEVEEELKADATSRATDDSDRPLPPSNSQPQVTRVKEAVESATETKGSPSSRSVEEGDIVPKVAHDATTK
jgi:intermembrane space import and assembly protein 40